MPCECKASSQYRQQVGDHRTAKTVFTFRVTPIEGEPWFVAADAGRPLGFCLEKGIGKYLRSFGPDEVRVLNRTDTPDLFVGKGTRAAKLTVISESGPLQAGRPY